MTVESYVHEEGTAFSALPEIYQIELTNHCNLACPMCLRTTGMVRRPQFLDRGLIQKMLARGDFAGTAYTELQMAGEPTLHPELGGIIDDLKTYGLLVGASTHGHEIQRKPGVLEALLKLDALTISVDSVDPEMYAAMRPPTQLDHLIAAIDAFVVAARKLPTRPLVELQLIQTVKERGLGDANLDALHRVMQERGWGDVCTARVQGDCFPEMQNVVQLGTRKRNADLCINPWSSVSMLASGQVVSCCYIFEAATDAVNSYGNLSTNTLAEVWASAAVQAMRVSQKTGELRDACRSCFLKSPTLIHQNIVARLVRNRAMQERT
jgi:hypothetical protein